MMNKGKRKFSSALMASVMAFTVLAGCCIEMPTKTTVFADTETPETTESSYYTDFDTSLEAYEAGDKLNKEIVSEGITLLKNESSLPLKQGAKISVFGKRSVDLRYGGAGSGAGASGEKTTLEESLEHAGFSVNPTLTAFYKDSSKSGKSGGSCSTYGVYAGVSGGLSETPVSSIESNVDKNTYSEYGDAAIIVISRSGAEGGDVAKGMSTGFNSEGKLNGTKVAGARNYDDHYLQLDQNETDLIKYVGDNFENVIVLFNTGSQMEVGFLDDVNHYAYHKNIKGALWIGYPGNGSGLDALGEILAGTVNPSGHTVDTYARDFKLDPTWSNMPIYTNNLFKYSNFTSRSFVNYTEGIYSGYRYYETRGYTEGDGAFTGEIHGTTTTEWENWYRANVVYPFGYGLSYTDFEWELVESSLEENAVLPKDGTISLKVRVTNTGDVAGKDVVQLYYTAPYTAGGIEKAYVALGDYVKTDLLQPEESQVVTLEISAEDMASYDYSDANNNGFKGYELEAGEYSLKISRNAHESVIEKKYSVTDGYRYTESANEEYPVENRFEDAEIADTVYLSRSDWEGTWPHEPTSEDRIASQEVIDTVNATSDNTKIIENDTEDKPYYSDTMPTTGAKNGIVLSDLYGLDYDDPKWDLFLDQMEVGSRSTVGSMIHMIWNSGWLTTGSTELGIPNFRHEDGPSGIMGRYTNGGNYTNFASETTTASTWNKDLAYKKGLIIGNQGLFGNGKEQVNALYAPACNIHRSPFSGRNFEYFSEDALLSGEMAGNIVKGCNEKGMVTFIKHFAVNDQESNRDYLLTWANEQTIREIYLKPFQICVEKYNSHGIMSALNSLGATWTGGNYTLLTEVLRGEWGFDGVIITDYSPNRLQLNSNQCIRAGGDLILNTTGSKQNPTGETMPTSVANMRRAVHNVCYTIVNYTAFQRKTINVLGAYNGSTLEPAVDSMEYECSLASISLNNGDDSSKITYRLKGGSELPEGLTLSEDGMLTGTAKAQAEAAVFTVVAEYGAIAKKEATFTLPIVDKQKSVIYIREEDSVAGSVADGINAKIDWAYTMDGKKHTITYRLDDDSVLPEGLELTSDGVIKGNTSTAFSDYEIKVIAESEGMLPMTIRLKLSMYNDFAFRTDELSAGYFGTQYEADLTTVYDRHLQYSLRLGDKLPQGLALSKEGRIVGVPQETGRYTFTVIASGENYETTEKTFTLLIGIKYSDFELETATVSSQYSAYVNFAQGATDTVYTLTAGELPKGLTLSKDGILEGTPVEAGVYSFTITARSGETSDTISLKLYVEEAEDNSNSELIALACVGIAALVFVVALVIICEMHYHYGKKIARLEKKINKHNKK